MARAYNVTLGTADALTWQQYRDALVPGTYDPGPSTTGVSPDFQSIKTSVSSMTFTPGATYTGYEFNFFVDLPVSNTPITFRNCWFRGPATYNNPSATGLGKFFTDGHAPAFIYDCTFKAQNPLPHVNGLHGYRFTTRRCDVSYISDGLSTFRGASNTPAGPVEVDVQQTWIHDLVWASEAECQALGFDTPADGMHNDVWQHQGGTGAIVKYNTMEGYTAPEYFNDYFDSTGRSNGNITYQNNVGSGSGSVTGADIQYNLLSGGRSQVNYTTGGGGTLNDVGTYKNNRHVRDFTVFAILRPSGSGTPFTCDFGSSGPPDTRNKYTDDNSVVAQSNSGQ